jgi:hypothetical protein
MHISPALALECTYYAAEADLRHLMCDFAGADLAARTQVLSYAQPFDEAERGTRREL